jgi:hypothetical protein
MKKLELNQMEILNGSAIPSNQQITCFVISSLMGLVNPIGGILQGAVCLFMD